MNKFYKYTIGMLLAFALTFSFGFSTHAQKPNVDFFDVSHWNNSKGIPLSTYQTLKRGNINSVVIKISDGLNYIDSAASVNIQNAKQSGMMVSVYHYARFNSITQAKNEAINLTKKLQLVNFDKKKDGYVVLDIEENNLSKYPFDLTTYANIFIDTMKSYGYKVDLYSGSSYYNSRLIPSLLHIDKPWLAKYSSSYSLPNFTNGKGSWQWSDSYKFTGIPGHFDVSTDFYGKYTNIKSVPNATSTVGKIGSVSLINYMKSKNMDSSYANRTKLAKAYGIENYKGTAAQNLALLSKLKSGVKPAKVDTSKLTTKTPPPVKQDKPVDNEIKVDPKVLPKTKPTTQTKTATKALTKIYTYKIKSGDSLWTIAKSKNTTVSKLISLNNIKNPNALKIGQIIKYPTSVKVIVPIKITTKVTTPTSSKNIYYIVKCGDYIGKIANTYHISASQIKLLNKLDSHYTIYIGQKLKVK